MSKQQNHIILLQESFECWSILKIYQSWQLAAPSAFFLIKFLWLTVGDITLWISLFRWCRCLLAQGLWCCESHTSSTCIKQPTAGTAGHWRGSCTPGHFTGQVNQVDLLFHLSLCELRTFPLWICGLLPNKPFWHKAFILAEGEGPCTTSLSCIISI